MIMPTFGSSADIFAPFQMMKIELEKVEQKMEGKIIIIIRLGNSFSIEIFLNGLKVLTVTWNKIKF